MLGRIALLAQWQSNGLLIRRFWVRIPGGAPQTPWSEATSCSFGSEQGAIFGAILLMPCSIDGFGTTISSSCQTSVRSGRIEPSPSRRPGSGLSSPKFPSGYGTQPGRSTPYLRSSRSPQCEPWDCPRQNACSPTCNAQTTVTCPCRPDQRRQPGVCALCDQVSVVRRGDVFGREEVAEVWVVGDGIENW
jgi:hypothetical protein